MSESNSLHFGSTIYVGSSYKFSRGTQIDPFYCILKRKNSNKPREDVWEDADDHVNFSKDEDNFEEMCNNAINESMKCDDTDYIVVAVSHCDRIVINDSVLFNPEWSVVFIVLKGNLHCTRGLDKINSCLQDLCKSKFNMYGTYKPYVNC